MSDSTAPARRPAARVPAACWGWLLLAAAVLALYWPVLQALAQQWWDDPNYSHGFLVPLFSAFVIWERRARLRQIAPRPALAGLTVMLASLGLLFLGLLGAELYLTRISLIGVILGLLLFLRGWPLVKALAFPLAALLLMIPLPAIVYNEVVFPLQLAASQLAAGTLQTCRLMPVLREGNVLILPNATLEVAEACSGIRSLLALLALSVMYGYFAERRTWVRGVLCIAVLPIAVLSNAARVMFAAVGSRYWGDAVVEGLPHLLSGIVLFVVATGAMIGFHVLLRALARRPAPAAAAANPETPAARPEAFPEMHPPGLRCEPLPRLWRQPQPQLWLAVALLALAAWGTHAMRHGQAMPLRRPLQSLPLQLGGWQGTDDPLEAKVVAMAGADEYVNRIYVSGSRYYLGLYIGYYRSQATGDTIHSPKNCLPASGWQPVSSSRVDLTAPDGRRAPVNAYVIERAGERQVVLYWYQSHGRVIASEYRAKFYMIADALRWNRTDGALVRIAAPVVSSEAATRAQALRFAQQIQPWLESVIP